MVTIWWSPENRVSGAKGQTAHHGHCPIVHGSRVVLGQNGLRVSIVGLKAMLMPLPWGVSPGSLLGTSSGDKFWILSGQNLIVSRAEQGSLVCCSEVTHLPAPRLSPRVSLCSWKSYCRVNPREAGNQAALPTGVRKGWGMQLRMHHSSSIVHVTSATIELAEGALPASGSSCS